MESFCTCATDTPTAAFQRFVAAVLQKMTLPNSLTDVNLDEIDKELSWLNEKEKSNLPKTPNNVPLTQPNLYVPEHGAIISSIQQPNNQAAMVTLVASGGNQTVAQIPQPIAQVLKNYFFRDSFFILDYLFSSRSLAININWFKDQTDNLSYKVLPHPQF